MVKAQIGLGDSDEAAKILESILEEQPYNRDILYLLVDCHLDMNNAAEAEQAIIKLVEQEPANYPKFLELVKIHLAANELDSAARILSMSSEHLLVGGQADEFLSWTNEILARNPEQLDALRLLVRYYGWQRDAAELKNALERLAEAAHQNEAADDERYALSQLVMTAPHETEYARRLHEFNLEHGFDTGEFVGGNDVVNADQAENFAIVEVFQDSNGQPETTNNGHNEFSFADERSLPILEDAGGNEFSGEVKEFNFYNEDFEAVVIEDETVEAEVEHSEPDYEEITDELKLADKLKLQQEIESIEFYIEQGYKDLAENSLATLEFEFGQQPELVELRLKLSDPIPVINTEPKPEIKKVKEETVKEPEIKPTNVQSYESLDDLSEEFGFEQSKEQNENDYDTHYHTATAYREMGLTEDAIREFQNAIGFIDKTNDTRRFFQCSTLLGLCFMEKQMPNLAMMWYKRALEETKDLTGDEQQALWYELGNAYDTGGDKQKAIEYFEQIYALNVDYRDVVKRLQKLQKEAIAHSD
jgi:tetratricopeptide (TPR) repeat protein